MAPNPNYMADEVVREKNFAFMPIKHHSCQQKTTTFNGYGSK
jgi:hypothetical protein